MWSSLWRVVPALLALQNPTSPKDLTDRFLQAYRDLEAPGAIHKELSPTLCASYVSPRDANGTSTWASREEKGSLEEQKSKPLAVYLPGLDGYGISAFYSQFDDMADAFEFWRLIVSADDRSSLMEVVNAVVDFVQELCEDNDRRVVLVGESCGGVLASAVAWKLRNDDILQGLVLVNPATSFDETAWDQLVPLLTSLQYLEPEDKKEDDLTPYSVVGSLILSGLVPDREQSQRIVDAILDSLSDLSMPPSAESQREIFEAAAVGFRGTGDRLPPALLQHRVTQWLSVGTSIVNARLGDLDVPTLVVAGKEDAFLPSESEAKRLEKLMPQCETLLVPKRGHFVLDESVNLTEAILFSKIDPLNRNQTKKRYDPIRDWKLPSSDKIDAVVEQSIKPLQTAFSPVFISTDKSGERSFGLGKLPRPDGPILYVGNHQFAGLDLGIILAQMLEERNMFARGLAHPVALSSPGLDELGGRIPGLQEIGSAGPVSNFRVFGAVRVTPRNYYKLLASGQDTLLFPGGAKEALTGDKTYPLYWPEKVDFVRTAARFNATIVPISAIGMVDSLNVLLEPEDVAKLPFIGERTKEAAGNAPKARYDEKDDSQSLVPALALPKLPARNYFLFGKPIKCDISPDDKEACERVYMEAKGAVREGLDTLIKARQHDPFLDPPKRLAYERLFGKKASTFPIEELR